MHQITSGGSDAVYTCPHCCALYLMTTRRTPSQSVSCAICDWCDQGMVEWNSTVVPVFAFVARPTNDNRRRAPPRIV